MARLLKKFFFPILLLLIEIALFAANYKPGAFLIGWDNLFPEFNFGLNIKREINAIWQQYRGLGTIDGMAHASLILHDIERWLMSLILPTSLIRWVYIIFMHFLGGLGMYMLLSVILGRTQSEAWRTTPESDSGRARMPTGIIAFLAALFYQYNLGTVQQFFLPLELFVVHFAFLPWLVFFSLKYLETGNKKDLLLFFLFSAISVPQAHVPTIFIVYTIAMAIIFISKLFFSKFNLSKKVLILILVIFVTNAYWGLASAYSTLTHAKIVSNSKSFEMGTNDIFYRNKKFGDFGNVALFKGVSLDFNYLDYKTGQYQLMMQNWIDHMQKPYFKIAAWLFFFLALLGLIKIVKERNKKLMPFAALFVFSFFMMATDTPLVGSLSNLLRTYVPLFGIVFRFTFTKFSILYAFSYSVLLAVGATVISNAVRNLVPTKSGRNASLDVVLSLSKDSSTPLRFARNDIISSLFLVFYLLLIILYSLPSFTGHFFYENLAVKIPQEYFQTFDFFNKQNKDERIASLPLPWYWAWLQPNWGTISSGFIWYGLPQPITDMAFTYWNDKNENFYWELDQAVFSKDAWLLAKVLKKYDISWVYLDKNIYNSPGRKMTYEDYENLLSQMPSLKLAKKFNNINIYKFEETSKLNNFIGVKNNLANVGPNYNYDNYDAAYLAEGDYISNNESLTYYYPFRSLFSNKNPSDQEFRIEEDDKNIVFKSKLPQRGMVQHTSNLFAEEFKVYDKNLNLKSFSPQVTINKNSEIRVTLPKDILLKYDNYANPQYLSQKNNACDKNQSGQGQLEKVNNEFKLTSVGTHNCVKIELPDLSHRFGYLLDVNIKTDKIRGLLINWFNETSKKSDLEVYTDNDGAFHNYHFILSPQDFYGMGYTLYFDNLSEGREKVSNILGEVKVYQLPYYFLKELKFSQPEIVGSNNSIVYLSQSFSPGWKAWINGKELKEHVLVNNWANGWIIPEGSNPPPNNITVIFWPQYLEFLGFGLMILSLIFILKYRTIKPYEKT